MTTLTTPIANMSLKIPVSDKEALQKIAKQRNRSTHFIMLEMIQKGLQEAQEEAEYQKYIKNRVMEAYQRLKMEGSDGITSAELKKSVMETLDKRLKHNQ